MSSLGDIGSMAVATTESTVDRVAPRKQIGTAAATGYSSLPKIGGAGHMIAGYKILRELGRGGMATVYLALQESLNREVALKILMPALASDKAFAERFVREARIAGGFRHRHLISVFDTGQAGEHLYLAMEYVPGGTAAGLIAGDPEEIRRCMIEVASALSYAHARGIVHRDIKPDNILRREDGSYVLSDFGIARSTAGGEQLTAPQATLGTPAYMSPEQWRNQSVDGRTDLYALGIVLHQLLTGQLPYADGDSWSMGMQHIQAPRPLLPEHLRQWQPVLDGLLAAAPADRYASADALIEALTGRRPTPPTFTPPQGRPTLELATPPRARAPASTARQARMLVVGALVLLLGYAGSRWWSPTQDNAGLQSASQPATPAALTKSIAVLPFRVLSEPRDDDSYFADGLSEEIQTTLAAIPQLRVAGRTSSFAWKGKDADMRQIAAALGVAHVLEGSVRRSGSQRRISASLIDVADNSTRWSETFDSEDGDVFAIQTRIATAVADRLSVSMGTRTLPTLARLSADKRAELLEIYSLQRDGRRDDMASVRARIRALINQEDVGPDLVLRLIFVDAQMMRLSLLTNEEGRREQEEMTRLMTQRFGDTLERKIADALSLQSKGDLTQELTYYEDALKLYREVHELAPNDALVAINASHAARTLLDFDAGIRYAREAVAIEPDDPVATLALTVALGDGGEFDEALRIAHDNEAQISNGGYANHEILLLASSGRVADALVALGDCAQSRFGSLCPSIEHIYLKFLGLDQRVATQLQLLAARDESGRREALAWAAIESGQPVDPSWIDPGTLVAARAMDEALAQGDDAGFRALAARRYPGPALFADPSVRRNLRFAERAIWPAFSSLATTDPIAVRAQLQAVDLEMRKLRGIPLPIPPNANGMVVAALLGDIERAIAILEPMSTLSPLLWDRYLISPSGRDMPLARTLRAHPKFAQIWKSRAAIIARERERIRALRPDLH